MSTVKPVIGEVDLDVVVFERPIKKGDAGPGNWPTGTEGAVVNDYGGHKEIELVGEEGDTLDMIVVPVEHLKPNGKRSRASLSRSAPKRVTKTNISVVQQAIGEVDVVALERPIKKAQGGAGNWPTGTTGTVVSDYGDDKEIEIVGDKGETLDLIIVSVEYLKLIAKHS